MDILCFGSLNIDLVFDVDNFVQPKETITSNNLSYYAGGKGLNQAIAINKAGAAAFLAGSVGSDYSLLFNECDKNNLNIENVQKINGNTGMAIIQVDKYGENCIVLHDGANHMNSKLHIDHVFKKFKQGDYLVIQNEINNLDYIIETACKKEMVIFINPSPISDSLMKLPLEKCDFIILNEVEGYALTGEKSHRVIVERLASKYKNQIILTVGKDGVFYNNRNEVFRVQAMKVDVRDSTGAGDAFMGYFIAEISRNSPIDEALEIAVRAAGLAVTRVGASDSIPTIKEVKDFVSSHQR